MNSLSIRRTAALAFAMLVIAIPTTAARRRGVASTARPPKVTGVVRGTVTDAVTGLPVISAKAEVGRSDSTNSSGQFDISDAFGYGTLDFEVSRSGYLPYFVRLPAGEHNLTIRLTPTPTVTLRKTDQTVVNLDYESLKFRYSSGFSGSEAEYEEFCQPDGSIRKVGRSQFRKMTGPATYINDPGCCTKAETMRMTIELKNEPAGEFRFADSCSTVNPMSIRARNHVTGEILTFPLTEVSEVVFP